MPRSTAQETFVNSNSKEEDALAVAQRKEDANKVFARVRPAKPNFTFGSHKPSYLSENKDSMKKPTEGYVFSKEKRDQQVATQRQHNFQMSFEQGN